VSGPSALRYCAIQCEIVIEREPKTGTDGKRTRCNGRQAQLKKR
jgi:hypothetical protein